MPQCVDCARKITIVYTYDFNNGNIFECTFVK